MITPVSPVTVRWRCCTFVVNSVGDQSTTFRSCGFLFLRQGLVGYLSQLEPCNTDGQVVRVAAFHDICYWERWCWLADLPQLREVAIYLVHGRTPTMTLGLGDFVQNSIHGDFPHLDIIIIVIIIIIIRLDFISQVLGPYGLTWDLGYRILEMCFVTTVKCPSMLENSTSNTVYLSRTTIKCDKVKYAKILALKMINK